MPRILSSALLLGLFMMPAAHARDAGVVAIAGARGLPPGAVVTVEGVVTVASGTYDAGFAVQDASGGIYVSVSAPSAATLPASLPLGTRVRVRGTRSAPARQAALEPQRIVVLGTASMPAPRKERTGTIGADTEGWLITAEGAVGGVSDDGPWGWKLSLDDGSGPVLVFIAAAAHMDVRRITGLSPGTRLRVTGFSGRYEDHSELLPRGDGDLAFPGAAPAAR